MSTYPSYPDLAGKVVVVTGGSRGIGAATCRALAASGAKVAVNGRDNAAVVLSVQEYESMRETLELLSDPKARERLETARAEMARGDYTTRDEMAELMERRRREAGAA